MLKSILFVFALYLAPQTTPVKVVALGDSITRCFNVDCWTDYVSKNSRYKVINKGIGGETLKQMNKRLSRDVIAHKPEIAIIMGGTNDVFYRDYDPIDSMTEIHDMVAKLKANGIHPIIGMPLPLTNKRMEERLEKLRVLIIKARYPIIYFESDFKNEKDLKALLPDGVHPNKKGKIIMGQRAIVNLNSFWGE